MSPLALARITAERIEIACAEDAPREVFTSILRAQRAAQRYRASRAAS